MFAFDTNILTGILLGNTSFVRRASAIPVHCQSLPVVVAEEIMRGSESPRFVLYIRRF